MKAEIDAQSRKDPGASSVSDRRGPALSAWAAEEFDRFSGQELTETEARARADPVRKVTERKLDSWRQ